MKKYIPILLLIGLIACSGIQEKKAEKPNISEHALTMATLYSYYAAEYDALCHQAYNIATERLEKIREEYPNKENLAIVLDLDETVLDNSPYQAMLIAKDTNYPHMWNEWCNLAAARPIPGVMAFLDYADANGFNIFYLSNRKEKYVLEGTIKNMELLAMPQSSKEHFLLRRERSDNNPNPSDKQPRRDQITDQGFEIVLLIGDNLGDLYTDEAESEARLQQLHSYREDLGRKLIILPNAMYGNWPSSLGIDDDASMDSLLLLMTKAFEKQAL